MYTINGAPLMADAVDILSLLKKQAQFKGKELFAKEKYSGNSLMTTCPFHKDGQERKPSFGIHTESFVCHCFSCGWSGYIEDVASWVIYDTVDDGKLGREWLTQNFITVSVDNRRPLKLDMSRHIVTRKKFKGFTEEELDTYRYYHPYMYKRGLTDEIISAFDIGYDARSECITFPVYNLDKTSAFIARRSVKSKFFNYPEGAEKPVYGAERFVSGEYVYAVIAESILNCLTCWKYNIPAMALIGTGTARQYKILRELPVRKYILATDPDEAGRKAADKLRKELSNFKIITQYDIPAGEDLNSLDEKILGLEEFY